MGGWGMSITFDFRRDVPLERLYFATIVQTPSQELGGGVCW